MKDKILVKEIADRLGVNQETIRKGLISGKFKFGEAIKMEKDYSYVISRRRFEKWASGEDMNPVIRIGLKNLKKHKIYKRV